MVCFTGKSGITPRAASWLPLNGHVVAHEREIYPKFGVGKDDSHHTPRSIAVVAAGGFFPYEGGAMMKWTSVRNSEVVENEPPLSKM